MCHCLRVGGGHGIGMVSGSVEKVQSSTHRALTAPLLFQGSLPLLATPRQRGNYQEKAFGDNQTGSNPESSSYKLWDLTI